ncbi:MAG: hypothetical protein ACI9HK_003396, partial [Pirellulaceae bacterium]
MRRITLSMAALGVLAMFSTATTASDFSVFLRHSLNTPQCNGHVYAPPVMAPPRNYHSYSNRIAPTVSPVAQYRGEVDRQQYLRAFERRAADRSQVYQALYSQPIRQPAHDRLANQIQYQTQLDQQQLRSLERQHV